MGNLLMKGYSQVRYYWHIIRGLKPLLHGQKSNLSIRLV